MKHHLTQPIAELYAEWESSGQTIAAFSREKGIKADRLYFRRRSLKAKPAKPKSTSSSGKFLPMVLPESACGIAVSIGAAKVQFDASTNEQLFRRVVRLLSEEA